ncbi:hypothetical protein QC764_110130 [Podospora pseudoanserina]|uniref:Protein pob1 n=1 Tax=Podospora pseudoanserina TaxID=2609844 RepID=A0ABR0IMX3_9PEZI|nr:hypothetical protein QC764_110130 [Podospora pseudoanserina]
MAQVRFAPREHPQMEMREKGRARGPVFTTPAFNDRPNSVYTEFMESEAEMGHEHDDHDDDDDDDEVYSEFGDLEGIEDGECSPRASIGGSSGQHSFTTLSTYDEVQTPRSLRQRPFAFDTYEVKQQPVEGPRGPHLFRSSMSSAQSIELQHALSLSPVTPKKPHLMDYQLQDVHLTALPKKRRNTAGPFEFTDEELDTSALHMWSPEMVAQRMLNAGVELPAAEKFVENDITGAILITLKFEDLKELGISSFGVRTLVWEEIHSMRDMQKPEPMPETPIEDEPDKQVRRELKRKESGATKDKRKPRLKINDVISPLESVSIVGIEQVLPKPHQCSKGENCSKAKRYKRLMEAFQKDHPFLNDKGVIMLAGDLGKVTATTGLVAPEEDEFRPVSDVVPSVVASSDVMGPGAFTTMQYLQEAALRNVETRDAQDNVRHFLDFQHQHSTSSEVPPTPPFEISPVSNSPVYGSNTTTPQPHTGLRGLPKLSIPTHPSTTTPNTYDPQSARARSARPISQVIPSFRELSPSSSESTPTGAAPMYRFGTPFSEMDVPITITSLPAPSRDFSQSVPPDMNYRNPTMRSLSRNTIRRPSFPVMPALDENSIVSPLSNNNNNNNIPSTLNRSFSQRRPLQAPPRVNYPWTQTDRPTLEKAIPPTTTTTTTTTITTTATTNNPAGVKTVNINGRLSPVSDKPTPDMTGGEAISYQGLMKKRKTKMLRHEWHEHFFRLQGTRLTMHKDEKEKNRTLEYIDIDDYAIACSSMQQSGNKLGAAFKAMHIRRGSDELARRGDVGAFSFQLVPQDGRKALGLGGVLSKKKESGAGGEREGIEGAVNGTGKTHHFAVKGRDERIDWMRELMLAKAMKQKGEGFEVVVNGNMI